MVLSGMLSLAGCKRNEKQDPLASYVSKEENGLIKRTMVNNDEVVSQLVPEKKENLQDNQENQVYRFMVHVNTKPEKMTDSILYHFNYRSSDYFRLISGTDTALPVLSERVASGRREAHQFTVVFDMSGIQKAKNDISLLFLGNPLFQDSLLFNYREEDIKRASKSLYGYE